MPHPSRRGDQGCVLHGRVGVQRRGSELLVDIDIRGSRPARCDTVHVSVVPGSLKLVETRECPLVLTEVLVEVRAAVAVDLRRRVTTHVLSSHLT
jgi:hypothetical protein